MELLRVWEYWKGYYDPNTYQFKFVADFRLLYTVDEIHISNSAHLHRLINSTIRLPVRSFNEMDEHIFVNKWMEPITE